MDERTQPVFHQGEELGAFSVAMPANDPMDPAKEKLVADLAAQAGLVLRNVGLTEALPPSARGTAGGAAPARDGAGPGAHDDSNATSTTARSSSWWR